MRRKLRVGSTYDFEGGGVPAKQAGGVAGRGKMPDAFGPYRPSSNPCSRLSNESKWFILPVES